MCAQGAAPLLQREQASRSGGHWVTDLTSGPSSVRDKASFCQLESSGEFRLRLGSRGLLSAVPKSAGARAGLARSTWGLGARHVDVSENSRGQEAHVERNPGVCPAAVALREALGGYDRSRFPGAAATPGGQCGTRGPTLAAAPAPRQRPPPKPPGCGPLSLRSPASGPEPILLPPELGNRFFVGFRSCRLQCLIYTLASEFPKPQC